jgi:glutamate synthase domain-containing protein 3
VADKYWNARGGSSSDGGAFVFNVERKPEGPFELKCFDKFGVEVKVDKRKPLDPLIDVTSPDDGADELARKVDGAMSGDSGWAIFSFFRENVRNWDYNTLRWTIDRIAKKGASNANTLEQTIDGLTLLIDRKIPLGHLKRAGLITIVSEALYGVFRNLPPILSGSKVARHSLIDYSTRRALRPPVATETTLVVDAGDFEPEGDHCDAALLVDAYNMGWKRFILFNLRGQRFEGCGFGSKTEDVRIDMYGSSGDYVASGIDGMEVHTHGNAQDQIAQIMKRGKLVIHGDTGQCFMYGAKGGEVYVLGNAAGRPLINAAGRPRVVINGAALDFLAESFMAGDPHKGGGFVIVNGLWTDEDGNIHFHERPYPGSNLFSLASGGAIFIRDPNKMIVDEQLNGGRITECSGNDWELILPYLEENERLFGIPLDTLLTVNGQKREPTEVYRKVEAVKSAILSKIPDTDDAVWAAETSVSAG